MTDANGLPKRISKVRTARQLAPAPNTRRAAVLRRRAQAACRAVLYDWLLRRRAGECDAEPAGGSCA